MATLNLTTPVANQNNIIKIDNTYTQIDFNFELSDVLFEKVDNNLELYFSESDSTIVLEDFYSVYSSDNMPEFLMAEGLISGEDFFAALDSSLMPAAGNENTTITNETHSRSDMNFENLSDSVDALDGNVEGGSAYNIEGAQGIFGSSSADSSNSLGENFVANAGSTENNGTDSSGDSLPETPSISSPNPSIPPLGDDSASGDDSTSGTEDNLIPELPSTSTPPPLPTTPPTAAALVDDFVSLNAGASAKGNLLDGEDSSFENATITGFEVPEGWSVQEWTSGEFVLTYNDNPDFKIVVQPNGEYHFTTPEYTGGMQEIDINSILKYTVEDANGVEHEASVTFSSNSTTEENILIDGDFTDHTITITNVDSQDQNTYEYTTAGYEKGGTDVSEAALSALFLGQTDDKVEVTGTLGYGSDGVSHHIYGDELQNYKDAGNDTITVGKVTSGGNIRADGNLYNGVVGGDDEVNLGTVEGNAVITGDGWHLYSGSTGGNDQINIDNMNGGEVLGDAYTLYHNSTGGDDQINIGTMNGGSIYADSKTTSGLVQGGDDTVTVNEFGTGKALINGGAGEDTFTYASEEDAYIDFSGTNIVIEGTNATITNFENLNTGVGNDVVKISSETLDSFINTGEGFDLVYTDDASMQELLDSNNISDAEMLLTGGGIEGTSQEEIFEELGIDREDGMISLDDSWSMLGSENGGSIFSNGVNEIWLNSEQDSSSADTGFEPLTWNSTDLLGGTDIVTDFQEGDMLDLTELKEAGYEVTASNGENGEGILTITDTAGDTAQTIIIPDVKFSDDEMRDADNIDFINM